MRKVLAGSPFFRGGNGLHSVEKDFIKSFQLIWTTKLSSLSLKTFLKANHMSSGVWPAPAEGQSAQSPPLQLQFLLLLTGDCIPPTSTEISGSLRIQHRTHSSWWIRLPPLFKMAKLIYPQIGAGVWRQLVNVVGTGGLSPRPARRGLLSTSCVAVWDGYRDIVADS